MKYRSRTDIAGAILRGIADSRHGLTRTKIMYCAYISYDQLGEYVDFLLKKGLIQSNGDAEHPVYTLTPKGLEFLHALDEINELLGPEEP